MDKEQTDTLHDMIYTFGAEKQLPWAIEECAELTELLAKILRGGTVTRSAVIDEIADVIIVSNTLRLIYDPYEVDMAIKSKISTIQQRIQVTRKDRTGVTDAE